MGQDVDLENGLREMVDLWSAETADALHRVLVLYPPIRARADAFEPMALLQHHHETEPGTSPTTALLLLTDRRWRSGVGRLARAIADSGILTDEHIDLLAATFLAADDAVFWQVPDDWFAGGVAITLDRIGADDDDRPGDDTESSAGIADAEDNGDDRDDDQEPEGPAVARRTLPPPLRRWATTHAIRREPARWGAMITRARELDARHRAAIMAGLMDAIDALEPPAQRFVVGRALTSRDHGVRRLALQHLAQNGDVDKAYALAKVDPNRRIRDWADDLVQPSAHDAPPPQDDERDDDTRHRDAPRTHPAKPPEPPTLF